jgi:hypothetical protein
MMSLAILLACPKKSSFEGVTVFTTKRQLAVATVMGALILIASPMVLAQSYPTKPIKMIVPFPAGGTTDVVARIIAQRMTETMGQPVLIENPRVRHQIQFFRLFAPSDPIKSST